ncbi:MAG: OadG family protein [Kiritimatiellales bacterium]|nr:OadG family protein [Kiritimatiellales bacterium]
MDLLMQGIVLMVVGMMVVFSFLALLVLAMSGSAAFFRKFAHLFPEEVQERPRAAATDPVAEIAVALAAIRAQRG